MSTSSINPGLANLLQTLSQAGSPLISSPNTVAALVQASPSDIVQLSTEAIQLQGVDEVFGQPATPATDPLANLEQALVHARSNAPSPSSTTAPTTSLASALANYQYNLQTEEMQSLFGTGPAQGLSTPGLIG